MTNSKIIGGGRGRGGNDHLLTLSKRTLSSFLTISLITYRGRGEGGCVHTAPGVIN